MNLRACLSGVLMACLGGWTAAQTLPPAVEAALAGAGLPNQSVAMLVIDAEGRSPARLSHRAGVQLNPASVMKVVTTYAALDLLGPAYTWRTPVYVEGAVRDGTLYGNLYIQGQGDPKLVSERLWLLLRRVQGLGVQKIAGDIVLDNSAFQSPAGDPAQFDGEPLRPYNALPDALLVNFKSISLTFVPDAGAASAQVHMEPSLAGVQLQTRVPLAEGDCGDWRASLKADFADPDHIRFAGGYPLRCAEKEWAVAYVDPRSYATRAVAGLWQAMGGQLGGQVREGRLPGLSEPVFEISSPPLAEVIRDINKYSNNVMAQQVFLTLSLPARRNGNSNGAVPPVPASPQASREVLRRWWTERFGADDLPVVDNGSGLSRQTLVSAQGLARLLQAAYRSPLMPDLMASLPLSGVDGTLRNRRVLPGGAHLKTGSLRDVTALAGYVHGASGRRYVLVAIANHPNAAAARPAFDALLEWAVRDK
jgi:D-alanyl-D-alanine carboxypeptidase/D-alanyl-D-alanine-endopeptidase (penicillin-binding protein 4)